jgi:hypothetical protein
MFVFVVHSDLIVQNGVKTDVPEVGDSLYGAEIVAIALTECKNGPPRAEHLLPEVRKRSGLSPSIDFNMLLGDRLTVGSLNSY